MLEESKRKSGARFRFHSLALLRAGEYAVWPPTLAILPEAYESKGGHVIRALRAGLLKKICVWHWVGNLHSHCYGHAVP